jgi:hypothetical protein
MVREGYLLVVHNKLLERAACAKTFERNLTSPNSRNIAFFTILFHNQGGGTKEHEEVDLFRPTNYHFDKIIYIDKCADIAGSINSFAKNYRTV